jgi:ABC-type Zn2+ transport system substrate-binding protein/surface adhesin
MPRLALRFLALVLLALCVPLQGVAAVMAGQCMALGHHQDAGSAHPHDAHHGGDGHDHDSHSHDGDNSKKSHCGPCTACCASASIAGSSPLAIALTPSSAKYVFSQSSPPSVPLDGLDRPPLAL